MPVIQWLIEGSVNKHTTYLSQHSSIPAVERLVKKLGTIKHISSKLQFVSLPSIEWLVKGGLLEHESSNL